MQSLLPNIIECSNLFFYSRLKLLKHKQEIRDRLNVPSCGMAGSLNIANKVQFFKKGISLFLIFLKQYGCNCLFLSY